MPTHQVNSSLPNGGLLSLRPVTPADEDFILTVYASTRADELAQVQWTDEQKEVFLRWQSGLQRSDYEARFPDTEYDLILVDGTPAGRRWVATTADEIRLLDIAILPEFQNRGIGTILLRQLIEESKRVRKPLRHMVFILNSDAQRFYERLGFRVFEELGAYRQMEWRDAATRTD
jgi:ribosomal protein S18 acetylase RimI-like enzyme